MNARSFIHEKLNDFKKTIPKKDLVIESNQ